MDDTLKVFDVQKTEALCMCFNKSIFNFIFPFDKFYIYFTSVTLINHNNSFLNYFKPAQATWCPLLENVLLVGSIELPKRVKFTFVVFSFMLDTSLSFLLIC